jgi:hypothetical protein
VLEARPTYRQELTEREIQLLNRLRPLELEVLQLLREIDTMIRNQSVFEDRNAFSPAADKARRDRLFFSNARHWHDMARHSIESAFMFMRRTIEQPLTTDVNHEQEAS